MATIQEIDELKINYLSDSQFKTTLENNQINENEIYMTPTEDIIEFEGSTSFTNGQKGLVPAPSRGSSDRYLCANGEWRIPSASYSNATTSSDGLMSATDKSHLDTMYTALSDEITQAQVEALFT